MSSKFYQVVQQRGPFGDRRDRHISFSKHEAEARSVANRQRAARLEGDVVVYVCRFGSFAHRQELLRLPSPAAIRFELHPSNRCGEREPVAGELICNRTADHDGNHESWSGAGGRLLGSWARTPSVGASEAERDAINRVAAATGDDPGSVAARFQRIKVTLAEKPLGFGAQTLRAMERITAAVGASDARTLEPGSEIEVIDGLHFGCSGRVLRFARLSEIGVRMFSVELYEKRTAEVREDFMRLRPNDAESARARSECERGNHMPRPPGHPCPSCMIVVKDSACTNEGQRPVCPKCLVIKGIHDPVCSCACHVVGPCTNDAPPAVSINPSEDASFTKVGAPGTGIGSPYDPPRTDKPLEDEGPSWREQAEHLSEMCGTNNTSDEDDIRSIATALRNAYVEGRRSLQRSETPLRAAVRGLLDRVALEPFNPGIHSEVVALRLALEGPQPGSGANG